MNYKNMEIYRENLGKILRDCEEVLEDGERVIVYLPMPIPMNRTVQLFEGSPIGKVVVNNGNGCFASFDALSLKNAILDELEQ